MATTAVHLSVDIGMWSTAAVLHIDGGREPVTFDGQTHTPSGVFIDDLGTMLAGTAGLAAAHQAPAGYVTDPLSRLHTSAAADGDSFDPVVAVSCLLAHVANVASIQAGFGITSLAVTTPQVWGPRSRGRLTQAATTAGLPAPQIVTTAAAAATAVTGAATTGTGTFVLVCSTGDDSPTITVLDTADGYTQLATATVRDPDAPGIDQALTSLAGQQADVDATVLHDWQVLDQVRRARATLVTQERAAVLLPAPYPAAVINRDDAAAAAAPHLARLPDILAQTVADADLDLSAITATILIGDDVTLLTLQKALADAGLTATLIAGQPYAITDGAAQLTHAAITASATSGTAATVRLPRGRLTLRSLTGTAVLAACSVTLLVQTVRTAYINSINIEIVYVHLASPNISLSAVLAVLTALSAASLAPTTWLTPAGIADTASTGILLRRAYLGAAGAGLAIAGLWGLGVGVAVDFFAGPYLRWALIAAVPVAVCAAIIGLAAPRIPADQLPAWMARLSPPVVAVGLGSLGVFLMRSAFSFTFPTSVTGYPGAVTFLGAALLGVATAWTATRQPLTRAVIGGILGIGFALVGTHDTAPYLTLTFVAALIWWTLALTLQTVRYGMPRTAERLRRWLNPA